MFIVDAERQGLTGKAIGEGASFGWHLYPWDAVPFDRLDEAESALAVLKKQGHRVRLATEDEVEAWKQQRILKRL